MHPQVISVLDLEQVDGDLAVVSAVPLPRVDLRFSLAPCDGIRLAVFEHHVI